ncbi:sensor domain-containing diguanylate cyclase [Rummeliibacillus sp. JY-2-4R]
MPISIYTVYRQFPPITDIDWPLLIGFIVLGILTATCPAIINGTPFFLTQWVSLAIFLRFGLFIEMVVLQITIIPFFFRIKLTPQSSYRIPWNSMMFLFISFISGFAFLLFGGKVHSLDLMHIVVYGLLYIVVNMAANHLLLKLSGILLGNRMPFLTKDDGWDYLICCFALPMGLSLYFLGEYVGDLSILLLGIPFYMATQLLRLYSNSSYLNKELSEAAHFGHQLTNQLDSEETLDLFMERVPKMANINGLYIVDRRNKTGTLSVLRAYENGQEIMKNVTHKELSQSLLKHTLKLEEKTIFKKKTEWYSAHDKYLLPNTQSVLVLPITRNSNMEGALLLTSKRKNYFKEYQVKILELLCSYFAVSLENSRYVQKARRKSERCGLTGLYNYRYFDNHLTKMMDELRNHNISNLSLIMMDIDYFKKINDNYGHQSGNDILIGIGDLLRRVVGGQGTIARYGGEEFVILLPGYTKEEALQLAEQIRSTIENQPFEISPDLIDGVKHLIVHVTASIGVSSAYEDTDEGTTLLRNADQAMYTGAKKKGRNRVAGF